MAECFTSTAGRFASVTVNLTKNRRALKHVHDTKQNFNLLSKARNKITADAGTDSPLNKHVWAQL